MYFFRVLRFFKFVTEGRFTPAFIDFNFDDGAYEENTFGSMVVQSAGKKKRACILTLRF